MNNDLNRRGYAVAKEIYGHYGVDTEKAMRTLSAMQISLQCWQGDDVGGFEHTGKALDGGLQVTGSYLGKARNIAELRFDIEFAMKLMPGRHRVNLHAIYGDFGTKVPDRDAIGPEHFKSWVDWAGEKKCSLDFNATLFSHPKAASGMTLTHPDPGIRRFWVQHAVNCRRIAASFGKQQGNPSVHNLWIPDGSKDAPFDRSGPRKRLIESLDAIYSKRYGKADLKDAVESKLFGIGSESYVAGSHEFYLLYALKSGVMPCLDMGHFHPTESIADKISSLLLFFPEILLHVSRGVRWDSDHVPVMNDELKALCSEIIKCGGAKKAHIALDFFDASINRVGAWAIGGRATLKSLLAALLEPSAYLCRAEGERDGFARLHLNEEASTLPFGLVWNEHCSRANAPLDKEIIASVRAYEDSVLSNRTS